jgi:presenilin-like A22 family membrane protease
MGLGDVVMPGILVIATYYYTAGITQGLSVFFLPFSVVFGTLLGFFILMTFVRKGKPQAGLPFLCGGAIAGYFVSSYLQFGALVGIGFQF